MKRLFLLILFAANLFSIQIAIAADPSFVVDSMVGQAVGNSCQSYVLALALAFKRDPVMPVRSWAQLRESEIRIRKEIEAAFKARVPGASKIEPTHADIKAGFEKFTSGIYRLSIRDVDITGFSNIVASKTGITTANIVPVNFLLGAVVKDVVLSSATRISKDSYKDGHLFTVFGMDGPPNSSRRFLILNGAVKVKDTSRNACVGDLPDDPGPYTASLGWRGIGDVELKQFGGKYKVWTIERN